MTAQCPTCFCSAVWHPSAASALSVIMNASSAVCGGVMPGIPQVHQLGILDPAEGHTSFELAQHDQRTQSTPAQTSSSCRWAHDARQANMRLGATISHSVEMRYLCSGLNVRLHGAMEMSMQVSICIQLLIKATCHTFCSLVAIYHHKCTQINADMLSNDVAHTSMTGDCSKVFTSTTEESSRHTR